MLALRAARRLTASCSAAAPPLQRCLLSGAAGTEVDPRWQMLITDHPSNNVTENVASHVGRGLLHRQGHPLQIIKTLIGTYFYRKSVGFQ